MSGTFTTASRWDKEWTDDAGSLQLGSGVQIKVMYADEALGIINMLVRFPPGYREPAHRHASEHSSVVLEGLQIVDGKQMHPGDSLYAPPDELHGPFDYPEGCVLFSAFRGSSVQHVIADNDS